MEMPTRRQFDNAVPTIEEREKVAAGTPADRQRHFANILVRHDAYQEILKFLDLAHMPLPGGLANRGRLTAIYAPYRFGKTTAIREYMSRLPDTLEGTRVVRRAVYYHCHGNMTVLDMLRGLYEKITGLIPPDKGNSLLAPKIIDQMRERGVELLVLDDIHAMMPANRVDNQRRVNAFLIKLLEEKVCHVTLSGPPSLDAMIRVEAQVRGRGGLLNPKLTRLDWRHESDRTKYRRILHGIDERLPMRRISGLGAPQIAAHFYDLFGDSVGFASDLIFYAMALAIRDGAECISVNHLSQAAAMGRDPADPFTHFIDHIPDDLVGNRRKGRGKKEAHFAKPSDGDEYEEAP